MMLDAVRALPEHLRDALWRIETARAATMEAPAAFVCGMGGSAIGGDLAVAALADRLTKPMWRPSPATRPPRRGAPSGWGRRLEGSSPRRLGATASP